MRYIFSILIIFFSSVALAVGGGGGGGSGGGGGDGGSSCSSGICELQCLDNGAISFLAASQISEINATFVQTGETFKVTGIWNFNRFTSDEVLFNNKGQYSINGFMVECSGLKFSCFSARIEINKCTKDDGHVRANLTLKDFDTLNNIKYEFKVGGNYYFYTSSLQSTQVKSFNLTQTGNNTYFLDAIIDGNVTSLQLSDNRCAAKTVNECLPSQAQGTTPSRTFLCYELPTLQERVRCRLELNKNQQEKELHVRYLPEECRALNGGDRDRCVSIYDRVQKCWSYPQGQARVECVKGVLGFTTIDNEKNKCSQNMTCIENIKNNVFTLIKFRFYDLEERAEEIYNKNPDLVSNVVSNIEQKKQDFNAARTLGEKKRIVLDVREIWKNFVREING